MTSPKPRRFAPTKIAAWLLWQMDETALRKDPVVETSLEKILYLLYWSQVWCMGFDQTPILQGKITATPRGIDIQGLRQLTERDQKNLLELTEWQEKTLGFVVRNYSRLSEARLRSMIVRTQPWKDARKVTGKVITLDSMKSYCWRII